MRTQPSEIISETGYAVTKSSSRLSRYNKYERLKNRLGDSYLESPTPILIEETSRDSFYQVEKGYENRLDLISYKFYRTPLLWWAIAIVNHIQDPMDVKSGIVLRIPITSSIYKSGGLTTYEL